MLILRLFKRQNIEKLNAKKIRAKQLASSTKSHVKARRKLFKYFSKKTKNSIGAIFQKL